MSHLRRVVEREALLFYKPRFAFYGLFFCILWSIFIGKIAISAYFLVLSFGFSLYCFYLVYLLVKEGSCANFTGKIHCKVKLCRNSFALQSGHWRSGNVSCFYHCCRKIIKRILLKLSYAVCWLKKQTKNLFNKMWNNTDVNILQMFVI